MPRQKQGSQGDDYTNLPGPRNIGDSGGNRHTEQINDALTTLDQRFSTEGLHPRVSELMVQRKNVSRLYLAASLSAERLLGDTRLRDEQSFVDVFRRQVVEMLDGVRRFSKDAAAEFFDGVGHLYAVDAKTGRTLEKDEVIAMAAGNYDADRPYKIISKQGVRELPVADKDPAVPERLWTFWRMASDNQGGRDLVMDLRYRGHDMNWLLKQ